MDRRTFLKSASAAVMASKVSAAVPRASRQVIVMITDSVRRDMLNCYRNTGLQTPNLDRIAGSGVRYQHAYTTQPVCAPARSAMWTGTYPHSNSVWGNSMPMGDTTHNLAEFLSQRGVKCGHIGKWHLDGFDYFGTGKPAPGWDPAYWYDQRDYLQELSSDDRLRSRLPKTGQDPKLEPEFTFAHRCSTRAIDFIAKHKHDDFLLVISYDEPHGPSIAPKKYSELYSNYTFPRSANLDDTLDDKPEVQKLWAGELLHDKLQAVHPKAFFGSLTFVDTEIGRVIDQIDKDVPGAMVVYTSDHGDMLRSHRLTGKGPAMYEEITNVPFLVRWKGTAPENISSDVPVSQIDLSGTLMEIFGQEVPKTFEGSTILPSIRDPQKASRRYCFIEWGRYEVDHDGFGGFQPIRCITDGRWKLSINVMSTDEFYNLQSDPGEMKNLILSKEHAELRNTMHDALMQWMDESRDPFRGYQWGRRAWRLDYPISYDNHGMTRQRESDGFEPEELDYDTGLPMTSATRRKTNGDPNQPLPEKIPPAPR